jgi:hypothetical protein
MLTVFYSSYINTDLPQTTDSTHKLLIQYFCTDESYPVIVISVINSTVVISQVYIEIFHSSGNSKKKYIMRQYVPKVIIYLTADLITAILRRKIVSVHFMYSEYRVSPNTFNKNCINILSNVLISYMYKD